MPRQKKFVEPQLMEPTPAEAYIRSLYVDAVRKFYWAKGTPRSFGEDHIPQWDGGPDRFGAEHKPVWPKLAAFYATMKLDPAAVIEAIFNVAISENFPRPPKPTDVIGNKAVVAFDRIKQKLIEEHASTLTADQERLRVWTWHYKVHYGFEEAKARASALMSGRSEISPLFRYIMGMKYQLPDVCTAYRDMALNTYCWNKVLLESWRKIIPPELDQEAEQFRAVMEVR